MSKLFIKNNIDKVVDIVNSFQDNHKKLLYNNFYGIQKNKEYDVLQGDHTLLLRIAEYNYYRLFVMSADKIELISFLKQLELQGYVINIPTKQSIEDWEEVLINGGFSHYTTYSHYCNNAIATMKKVPTTLNQYANIQDLEDVHNVLFRNFTTYASHLPSDDELIEMIKGNRVFVNRDSQGKVCGVNIYTITGKTAYGNAWVDEGGRGLELMFDMLNCFIDHDVKRYVFWVRDDNKNVIKMHKMLGGVTDGLKDYTYLKNINF